MMGDAEGRARAMYADVGFMRWLAGYLPDYELEYSGTLLGLYDAWRAAKAPKEGKRDGEG